MLAVFAILLVVIGSVSLNSYMNRQAEENKKFDRAKFSSIEVDMASLSKVLEDNNENGYKVARSCQQASVEFQEGTIYCSVSLEKEWEPLKDDMLNSKIEGLAQLINMHGHFTQNGKNYGKLGIDQNPANSRDAFRSFGYVHRDTGAICGLNFEYTDDESALNVEFGCSADAKDWYYPQFNSSLHSN